MPQWDAAQYLKFGTERTQPAVDLIQRIELSSPRRIIDLGCGPGNSTEPLRRRWPDADISGLDRSLEMIAAAREAYPQGKWEVGDAASWQTGLPFDLVFANAMLHWLPDHGRVCRGWMQQVAPGGALAVQQPVHYDDSARGDIIEVSKDPAWNDRMNAARTAVRCELPSFYYDVLQPLTSRLSIWETTYHHILPGPEGVLSGSGALACARFSKLSHPTKNAPGSRQCCSNDLRCAIRAGRVGRCCFRSEDYSLWRIGR